MGFSAVIETVHHILPGPVRKSGTVDLSPIPNEIYLEIFGYLRPTDPNEWIDAEARQHFCNLALVCRFFSSVMLPWIFENLTFVEKDSYSQISSPHSSTVSAKFCRNVLDGDPTALLLAKHVKRWAFSGSPTQSKLTPAFLSMYFETFQHLPNLLELSLTNIVIPRNFFKRLVNVPTLEALKLGNSSFDAEMRERHLKHFKSLPLKRLALVHSSTDSHLIRLIRHLNMTSLIRLELDLPFLKDLPLSNCSLPLEYLYLGSVEGSMPIAGFLEAMPYLKVLRVPWSLHSLPNSVLKPQVIPHLSELGGDWPFCASILPGRPISRVELFSMPLGVGRDQWKVLAGSTKPLIDLKVWLFCHIIVPFWEHFPDLESLEIRPLGLDATWGEVSFLSLKIIHHIFTNQET